MRVKIVLLILAIICFVFVNDLFSQIKAQQNSHRDVEPELTTLFSQIKYKDFTKANFNFKLGVRGDSISPRTGNNYDLRYSGNSLDGNSDWFDIPVSERSYSQIIDMGALNWTDIYDIPLLYANPVPHSGGNSFIFDKGKVIKITPENSVLKVIVGHMYLLHAKEINHAKETNKDFYAVFRVEALKSGDEVTISWKVVASPENQ